MVTRNSIRLAVGFLALACLQVAQAGTVGVSDFERLTVRTTGANTVAVTMGNPTGATNAVRIASTPSQMLANVSGWLNHHTWGAGSTASGIRVGQAGFVNIAGQKVPVTVATPITKAAMADGIGILFRNAAKLTGPLGVVMMLAQFADMLDAAGIRQNPDAANDPDNPFLAPSAGFQWRAHSSTGWQLVASIACQDFFGIANQAYVYRLVSIESDTTCIYQDKPKEGAGDWSGDRRWELERRSVAVSDVPANWEAVRPKFEAMSPLPSEVSQKVIEAARAQEGKNGIEPFKLATGASTLTAPSSLPSTTKTDTKTVGNTTTTTTTTTETGITTTGDTIKVSPTTTTTTTTRTTNPDGSVTENTTSETTTTETDQDPTTQAPETPGLCELYPEILACAKPELDTPDAEIPKEDRTITYEPESLFGEGSCPADAMATLGTLHQTVKVWDWQKTCQYALPLRAIVISLASFAAFLIVMPGESRV